MMASEVVSREATPAASVSAVRTTFRGSMMPAFTRSWNCPAAQARPPRQSRPPTSPDVPTTEATHSTEKSSEQCMQSLCAFVRTPTLMGANPAREKPETSNANFFQQKG